VRAKRLAAHIMGTLLVVTACHKRPPAVTLPQLVALPAPPVVVLAPAAPSAAVAALEQADRSFSAGVYDVAARAYEDYLRLLPPGCPCDQELFRLGLSYVLRRSPNPDWQRATAVLKQLVHEYPNSSSAAPANLILALRSEVNHLAADTAANTKQRDERIRQLSSELDRLSSELDRLKKIDSNRRTRP
jgi:TolA-binding protein